MKRYNVNVKDNFHNNFRAQRFSLPYIDTSGSLGCPSPLVLRLLGLRVQWLTVTMVYYQVNEALAHCEKRG